MSTGQRLVWAALAVAWIAMLAGCGTPGAPMPPSLNLPDPVSDLAVVRIGDMVTLQWTMPRRNTDKLLLKSDVDVRVCRREGTGTCDAAGPDLKLAPGSAGSFHETLPAKLLAGSPRPLTYFVELKNDHGRSAGMSNGAEVLAGATPAPVEGLAAEVRKDGVVLRWTPGSPGQPVRLERRLLTPQPANQKQGPFTPPPQPVKQDLLVDADPQYGRAIDKQIQVDNTYEYRAQRIVRIAVGGKTLELDSSFTLPLRVDVRDIFPPAIPAGLAAVATTGESNGGNAIDLSWQPDTEADLVGYIVYRREDGQTWQRISPAQPVLSPAFHDAHVTPGHTYYYAVSAIDQSGHESARSTEAAETVPSS